MPSLQLIPQSGGQFLVSGAIFSGTTYPTGGIQFKYASLANSGVAVYVGLPPLSGQAATQASGGVWSSGGLADGMEMMPGESYFVPKLRLVSGVETPRVVTPAGASGMRMFWEFF